MTVDWTWDSCLAATIAKGFGVVGVEYLRFLIKLSTTIEAISLYSETFSAVSVLSIANSSSSSTTTTTGCFIFAEEEGAAALDCFAFGFDFVTASISMHGCKPASSSSTTGCFSFAEEEEAAALDCFSFAEEEEVAALDCFAFGYDFVAVSISVHGCKPASSGFDFLSLSLRKLSTAIEAISLYSETFSAVSVLSIVDSSSSSTTTTTTDCFIFAEEEGAAALDCFAFGFDFVVTSISMHGCKPASSSSTTGCFSFAEEEEAAALDCFSFAEEEEAAALDCFAFGFDFVAVSISVHGYKPASSGFGGGFRFFAAEEEAGGKLENIVLQAGGKLSPNNSK
ncbi:hypothetical protein ACLB2K_023653 [Fragaria x ananassa]